MNAKPVRISCALAVVAITVCACAAHAPVATRLDSSGLTIVTLHQAVMLARPVPQIAVAARDYAYIGPVEINRMGHRDHYLWVGLASTVDRRFADASPEDADSLALLVDGQPMVLALSDWNVTLDQLPYSATVPLYATLSGHASLDQIERIAAANFIDVHVVTRDGKSVKYERWRGDWKAWSTLGDSP